MSKAVAEYEKLVAQLGTDEGVVTGQMFGKACLKVHGKAFIAQHKDWVVFKLNGDAHAKALAISGAELWDPSGKGRPMKEWVAVPGGESKGFKGFAAAALDYATAA